MDYFSAIKRRADELNEEGKKYLSNLPFMSNQDVLDKLWKIANEKYDYDRWCKSFDNCPWWVDAIFDGLAPYGECNNGSLYYMLGRAVVAEDALLRNLLEIAEGRESKELELCCVAEKEIVDKYCREG